MIDKEPKLKCQQVKMRLPKILAGIGRQTIQTIIQVSFDIPSSVRPKIPFLTEVVRQKRVGWAKTYRRWTKKQWRGVMFADESLFQTKQSTGGSYQPN